MCQGKCPTAAAAAAAAATLHVHGAHLVATRFRCICWTNRRFTAARRRLLLLLLL
jgi:hypothetical protein